jgi:hypothetical protein
MNEKVMSAVLPLLNLQRSRRKEVSLDECMKQAQFCDARADLVILLVRHELRLRKPDGTGLYGNLVVNVLTSHNGGIYSDDGEALEALNLVAQALGQTLTVRLIERP